MAGPAPLTPYFAPISYGANGNAGYGSPIPGVLEDPISWNTVTIAGIQYAGHCKVGGIKKNKIDRKRPPGTKGSSMTSLGFEDADLMLSFIVCDQPGDDTQWQSLQQILAALMRVKTQRNNRAVSSFSQQTNLIPVDVRHPALRVLGIASVYIKHVGVPHAGDGDDRDVIYCDIAVAEYQKITDTGVKQVKGPPGSITGMTEPNASTVVPPQGAVPATGDGTYTPAAANFTPGPQPLTPPSQSEAGP